MAELVRAGDLGGEVTDAICLQHNVACSYESWSIVNQAAMV